MPGLLQRHQSTAASSNASKFTYRLAAASAGKRTPPRPHKLGQDYWHYTSTQSNPTPPYLRSTKKDAGEDAFFATTIGSSEHHVALGLADGVGGWQDQGVDPSHFSHGLCGLMAGTAREHDLSTGELKPRSLLQTAYDAIMANPRILAGGSTASLCVIDGQGQMEAVNLGDSGYIVLSPGKVTARSELQTHAFNTPYQMSKLPPRLRAQEAIFGGAKHFSETPADADITRHALKHGDIVLFATDGAWDNLSAQDTLDIVAKVMVEQGAWFKSHNFADAETMLNASVIRSIAREVGKGNGDSGFLPGLLASSVMKAAKLAGLDRKRDGPFAKEVKKHYPQEGWAGGKPDDIAVVVAVAVEEDPGESKAKL
ncbi:protein serine/threonine phosphatase 2C [Polychaeton citri CBS 116435]|uniref:Protein phosphatase n=1 Tax=Polychaeton citri CBS 116435 TaxID=1314669 RepID=A0A9P4Q1R5_9PEZI|nr:protein serine/threonine phosphatase 2C [Polychaeton citri CBS 116435]